MIINNLEFDRMLEKKLKINYPNFENKCNEFYKRCLERSKKRNNMKFASIISSFACLSIICCIGFVLVSNNTNEDKIRDIENDINNLIRENNDEERMIKIINTEKKIKLLSNEEKANIANIDLFYYETKNTVLELKENAKWSEYLNNNTDYYLLENIFSFNEIEEMIVCRQYYSVVFFIEDKEYINDILNVVNVPFVEVVDYENNKDSIMGIMTEGVIEPGYDLRLKGENAYYSFSVCSNGYIRLYVNNGEATRSYISLIKIDYLEFKNVCNEEMLWSHFVRRYIE